MARKLHYSDNARRDIAQMRAWFSQAGAGPRAKERARKITGAIRDLRQCPASRRVCDAPGTRQFVVEGYTIVYRVAPDTGDNRTSGDVLVLRVYGPGQNRPRPQ